MKKPFWNFGLKISNGISNIGNSISSFCYSKLREIDGIEVTCKHCGKTYKKLLIEFMEDDIEEPYGGYSTYLVSECPHCHRYTEPNSEVYKLYYKK